MMDFEFHFTYIKKNYLLCVDAATPRAQLIPSHIDQYEYSPADIQCVALSSQGSPVSYEWTRLDGQLSPDAYASSDGWLRFNQLSRLDTGTYQCVARNEYGDDTKVLQIVVRDSEPQPTPPPLPSSELSIQPPNYSGRTGDEVVLTCYNVIHVYASLVWSKEGQQYLPSNVDVKNGVLTIKNARAEDSGRYICTSSIPSATPTTEAADVFVEPSDSGHRQSPHIKPLNELYTVVQGQDFSLVCEASGNPYPAVTWTKVHDNSLGSNVQQNGNILRILNAQVDNRGVYLCVANSDGVSTEQSTIIEVERTYILLFHCFSNTRTNV